MNNEFTKQCISSMSYLFLRVVFEKELYSEDVIDELSVVAEELVKEEPDQELLDAMKTEFLEGNYISTNDVNPYSIVKAVLLGDYRYSKEEAECVVKHLRKMRTLDVPLIALIGRSGVGKTSVAKYLEDKYDWTQVESYTTRPKRSKNEKGHQFITESQFNSIPKEEIMAYMKYRGYQYGATEDQLNEANLYVVDPGGYEMLKEKYKNRPILAVKLTASRDTLKTRMRTRGTSEQEIADRIARDDEIFDNFEADVEINTDQISVSEVGEELMRLFQCMTFQKDADHDAYLFVEVSNINWDASFEEIRRNNLPESTTILGAFKVKDYWKEEENALDQEKLGDAVSDWLTGTYEFTNFGCSINASICDY